MNIIFSIVLPCYNEFNSLPSIIESFHSLLKSISDTEVIFVNNGSTDNSLSLLNNLSLQQQYKWAKIVNVPFNQGYGHGLMIGLREAKGKYIGWTHADSQYCPDNIIKAIFYLKSFNLNDKYILQGHRIKRNIVDYFFTLSMSLVTFIYTGKYFKDINAQPKFFHRDLLYCLNKPPQDFSFDLYVLYLAENLNYKKIYYPIKYNKRLYGTAKGGGSIALKFKLSMRTFKFIKNFKQNYNLTKLDLS